MGLRLPLDSLPWAAAADLPSYEPVDPFRPRAALPAYAHLRGADAPRLQHPGFTRPGDRSSADRTEVGPARGTSARDVVRTALCAEVRNGVLYVFLPPVLQLDGYLALVSADRGDQRRARHADRARGLPAAGRPPPAVVPDHARPRRHRGQHPAGRLAGMASSRRPRPSTKRRTCRGSAPRSSCSTAGTRAPAAATTSCSAERRPPTARSCDARTCCAAWWRSGTTTRRCRTSSRGCSSGRPARRRAWTKPATTACTNWGSPSIGSASASTRRHGWWTVSCGTCWSTSRATPIAPSSASTSCTRRIRRVAAADWWSCGPSRCRRMRG